MTLEIQRDGVAEAPKGITPIAIPDGVDPTAFRSVLAAYTTAYRMLGRLPTSKETHAYWPRIPLSSVEEILVTPEFVAAAEARGIQVGDTPGLTHQQHLAIMAMFDRSDRRSTKAKLEAVGVTTQQYSNWLRNPMFAAARDAIGRRAFAESLPDLQTKMSQQAEDGSFQHQQFILETLGEGPKAREQANAAVIVQAFISAIQRATVGHPDIRKAILEEMQSAMATIQMTPIEQLL